MAPRITVPDLGPIEAFLEKAHDKVAIEVASFARKELADRPEPADDAAARVEARSFLQRMGGAGVFEPIRRQEWRSCCITREVLGHFSPLADAVFALQGLGTLPILRAGTADAKARWLDDALTGRAMAAFAMTEPEAGSDIASMKTTARRDGDSYVLNGAKSFISNAGIADFYTVFASTDPAAKGKGLSAFVVPADAPGFRFTGAQVLSSPHPLGEIEFRNCRVPAESRLGEEGAGMSIGLATLDRMRATVGAAATGMAQRALSAAIGHARARVQFGKPLAEFQLVQEKLAKMAVELTAARLLVYRAAWDADRGAARVTLQAAMAKAYATEAAQRIVDDAVQILGGSGALRSHPVDRLYRSVRALRIYEGTTEIQHLVIAGQLLAPPESVG